MLTCIPSTRWIIQLYDYFVVGQPCSLSLPKYTKSQSLYFQPTCSSMKAPVHSKAVGTSQSGAFAFAFIILDRHGRLLSGPGVKLHLRSKYGNGKTLHPNVPPSPTEQDNHRYFCKLPPLPTSLFPRCMFKSHILMDVVYLV
jgi:hypothetical protein